MKIEQIKNCIFSRWYPVFRDITIESQIVQLTTDFIDYLNEDGLVLPLNKNGDPSLSYEYKDVDETMSDDDEEDSRKCATEEESEGDLDAMKPPNFPYEEAHIEAAIQKFGAVFPKLNWSSPKDVTWITLDSTLACHSVSEVYLLLKSSDFVSHDINCWHEPCEDVSEQDIDIPFELVLRRWTNINPALEFRCFVRNNKIIAITQRDFNHFYPFLLDMKQAILQKIERFFKEHIDGRFFDSDLVFDVFLRNNRSVVLLDFNPFGPVTDALLYSWDELMDESQLLDKLRLVESQLQANANALVFRNNRYPRDVYDYCEEVSKMGLFSEEIMNR